MTGVVISATWVPSRRRSYLRAGGPWRSPNLDTLLSGAGGELVEEDLRLDRRQVEIAVGSLAGGLASLGLRVGQAVAWQLPNGIASALLMRACWRIGAVAVPLLHTMGESDRQRALGAIDPCLVLPFEPGDRVDVATLLSKFGGDAIALGAVAVRSSAVAVALLTSGSSGRPKAVLHTHRALSYKARLMAAVHGLDSCDSVLVPAPMAHVSGLLNGVLVPGAAGMKTVYMSRFDAERAVELVASEEITFMAGPPTLVVAMSEVIKGQGRRKVSTMRLISTGGASVTPAFVDSAVESFGCRVKRTYGSTEAPTVTTSTSADPYEKSRDTDGRAVGEVELRVVDPADGKPLESGASGELWVRGPELFAGYASHEQTREAIAPGGWFKTGDLATLDEGGWLRIVGRLKDVIIRGGENIAAAEVESVLEGHPAVIQASVVGFPDPLMGERVCAFVVTDRDFDLQECRRWFREKGVSTYKIPEKVVLVDSLPLLGSGKVDRAQLRQEAASR